MLAALVAAGCGLGAGETPTDTKLIVTEDFGTKVQIDTDAPKLSGEDTVMRMLERNADVEKRFGGKFVQSIDGIAGGARDGRAVDWLYYVNGKQADEGASSVKVHDGDSVWWDNHPWETTTAEAVVGQFPEPFVHGPESKRLPVRIECADPQGSACRTVQDRLVDAGVPASRSRLAAQLEKETLRVVVGPYERVRGDRAVQALDDGPQTSGVFIKPNAGGSRFALLDIDGKTRRTLGVGGGLVAAIQPQTDDEAEKLLPVWVVTGIDDAGVAAAASALDEGTLGRKFALAIGSDGRGISLPVR